MSPQPARLVEPGMTTTDRASWRLWARRAGWALFVTAAVLAVGFFASLAVFIGVGPP